MTSKKTAETSEIETLPTRLDDGTLHDLNGYRAAAEFLAAHGVAVETIEDYGSGFSLEDKEKLVGVPFIIVEWNFHEGDYGDFVAVNAITKHDEKVVFVDGSSGIFAQLKNISADRAKRGADTNHGLWVKGGLVKSEFDYSPNLGRSVKPSDGTVEDAVPATTYYLG